MLPVRPCHGLRGRNGQSVAQRLPMLSLNAISPARALNRFAEGTDQVEKRSG